jgi:muramoyltetrapeptide carboxypeptidase
LAGTDEERASDINEAIRDKEIKGIIALRGGYGTMRILPLLDYAAFRQNPKVVMGYSDITGLLNAITRKTGVVTYHGPIAEGHFDGFEGEWMRKAIFESDSIGAFGTPEQLSGRVVNPPPTTIQSGKAKGRLIGGNLSLIAPCAGTEYGPDFKDAILFLEDIGEAAYRVDRMLTGLWLGGYLQQLNGIFIGDFRPAKGATEDVDMPLVPDGSFSLAQVFSNLRLWTKAPICTGLYTGHIRDKLTLPIGAMVELDADRQTLTMLKK